MREPARAAAGSQAVDVKGETPPPSGFWGMRRAASLDNALACRICNCDAAGRLLQGDFFSMGVTESRSGVVPRQATAAGWHLLGKEVGA